MQAEDLMEEMTRRVVANEAISPASWLDCALRVNQLSQSLDNEIAVFEAKIALIEAEYVKTDMTSSKAKALAKGEVEYEEFLKKKAEFKRRDEFIKLSKRRAIIPEL